MSPLAGIHITKTTIITVTSPLYHHHRHITPSHHHHHHHITITSPPPYHHHRHIVPSHYYSTKTTITITTSLKPPSLPLHHHHHHITKTTITTTTSPPQHTIIITNITTVSQYRNFVLSDLGTALELTDNPLCAIANVYVGEGRSVYCDMFGQIIIIHRPGIEGALYLDEVFVNTMNTRKTYFLL